MSLLDRLKAALDTSADDWTEAERDLGLAVAEDYARLIARQVAGEDVESELLQVKAQAAALGTAAAFGGAELFWRVVEEELFERLKRLLMP